MTDKELKELKDTLWHSADVLRASAHLAANKYGQPILGLIFLRYADILYKQHKEEIEAEYNRLKGGRMEKSIKEISIEKCGFYLPECAYYDVINDAPDDANKATIVKKAMEAIEDENPKMDGVLPKEVYAQLVPEEEPELLSNIVRIFKDIPENSTIDIFGEIYEYFLGNFAFSEGKDGGTFYTPATVGFLISKSQILTRKMKSCLLMQEMYLHRLTAPTENSLMNRLRTLVLSQSFIMAIHRHL